MQNTLEQHAEIYQEFVKMHDLVVDIIDAIEENYSDDEVYNLRIKDVRLQLALPIINQFEIALAEITETYVRLLHEKRKANAREIKNLETQIRGVFITIAQYAQKLESMPSLKESNHV